MDADDEGADDGEASLEPVILSSGLAGRTEELHAVAIPTVPSSVMLLTVLDVALLHERRRDRGGFLGADAGHLDEPLRLFRDHLERLEPELRDQRLRERGSDARDQTVAE